MGDEDVPRSDGSQTGNDNRDSARFRSPIIRFRTIERPRLCQEERAPLTILQAPSGYGKSVLLAQWGAQWNRESKRAAWLILEGRYISGAEFWGILARALDVQLSERCGGLRARDAISSYLSQLTESLVIVIDNFEYATGQSLDLDLVQLLDCSPLVDLIVSGRRLSAMMSPVVTSQYSANVLTSGELAFTPEESIELARLYARHSGVEIQYFAETVKGWPFPIQVACSGALRPSDQFAGIVAEYLRWAGEGVGKRILYEIALCPEISVDALAQIECSYAEGSSTDVRQIAAGVREVCDALEDQGLLLAVPSNDRPRYSCHRGLEQVVVRKAKYFFAAPEQERLFGAFASDIEEYAPLVCLETYLRIDDIDRAEQVARRRFVELVVDTTGIRTALDSVASERTLGHAALDGLRFFADQDDPALGVDTKRERMTARSESMRGLLQDSDPVSVIFAECSLMASETMLGNLAEAHRLARDLDRRLNSIGDDDIPGQRVMAALLRTLIGYSATGCGDFSLAAENNLQALHLARRAGNPHMHIRALRGLVLVKYCEGEMREAQDYLDQLRALEDLWNVHHEGRSVDLSDMYIAETLMLYTALDGWQQDIEAQPVPVELLKADVWTVTYPLVILAESEGDRRLNGGNHALKLLLQRMRHWPMQDSSTNAYARLLSLYAANLMSATGDLESARTIIGRMAKNSIGKSTAMARVYLFQGEPRKVLDELEAGASEALIARQQVDQALQSAIALWQLGLNDQAVRMATEAVRQMELRAGYNILTWVPFTSLLELAEHMRDQGDESLYCKVVALPDNLRCHQYGQLSRAELRSLQALSDGESLEDTANDLFISINTLKFHLRSIYRKLNASNRAEALQRAQMLGLITQHPLKARKSGKTAGVGNNVSR